MGIKFITQTVECWIFSTLKRVSVFVCKWKMDDVPTISQNIMLLLCTRSVHYCREVKITWEWRFWIALWRSVGWVSMKVELRADIDVVNDAIDCMTKNRWSATFRLYGRIFDGATVWTWFLNEFLTFHLGPNWFTALHAIDTEPKSLNSTSLHSIATTLHKTSSSSQDLWFRFETADSRQLNDRWKNDGWLKLQIRNIN